MQKSQKEYQQPLAFFEILMHFRVIVLWKSCPLGICLSSVPIHSVSRECRNQATSRCNKHGLFCQKSKIICHANNIG